MTHAPKNPLFLWALVLATLLTIHVLPQLASVLVLLFAGIVLAVVLDAPTSRLERVTPGGRPVAYLLVLVGVLAVLAAVVILIVPHAAQEIPVLAERLPQAWRELIARLNDFALMQPMTDDAEAPLAWFAHSVNMSGLLSSTFGALFNVFIILFVGIYGAAAPLRYRHLATHALPLKLKDIDALAGGIAYNLRHWLMGRSASMAIVGIATGTGLWLLDVPLAFTLGLIAGVLSFVPYIGPILGLAPALLIAAVESPELALWVLVLYGSVQFAESAFLTPMIQQHVISMPPLALIAVQLIGGILIGPIGVLMAAPMAVTVAAIVEWKENANEPAAQ